MIEQSQGQTQTALLEPTRDRPNMPKDYGVPTSEEGMLEWPDIRALLEQARTYWISTTRPDGRPHAVPIWGAWVDDRFYCDGHPSTRWARNLEESNPAVVISVESNGVAIIVEGTSEDTAPAGDLAERIIGSFKAKYSYAPDVARGVYDFRPLTAFAWDESLKGATRWRFPRT